MELSEISELMAISVGMNFALIITSFSKENNLTFFLILYSENSKKRVIQKSINSIITFQNLREKINFSIGLNNKNANAYDAVINSINNAEEKIGRCVSKFLNKSKSCLQLTYLHQLSLILVFYALIVLGLTPFQGSTKIVVENSLLVINTFMIVLLILTILLLIIKPNPKDVPTRNIGYFHYFIYFIISFIFLIISFYNTKWWVFNTKIITFIFPLSLKSVIFLPFAGISFYLLRAFFIIEYQIISFKICICRLGLKKTSKVIDTMINDFHPPISEVVNNIGLEVSNGENKT